MSPSLLRIDHCEIAKGVRLLFHLAENSSSTHRW